MSRAKGLGNEQELMGCRYYADWNMVKLIEVALLLKMKSGRFNVHTLYYGPLGVKKSWNILILSLWPVSSLNYILGIKPWREEEIVFLFSWDVDVQIVWCCVVGCSDQEMKLVKFHLPWSFLRAVTPIAAIQKQWQLTIIFFGHESNAHQFQKEQRKQARNCQEIQQYILPAPGFARCSRASHPSPTAPWWLRALSP